MAYWEGLTVGGAFAFEFKGGGLCSEFYSLLLGYFNYLLMQL